MRLVIIGNGMSATRLIESLTERAPGRYAITVIGDEPDHAYNRIQLSPVLGVKNGPTRCVFMMTSGIASAASRC